MTHSANKVAVTNTNMYLHHAMAVVQLVKEQMENYISIMQVFTLKKVYKTIPSFEGNFLYLQKEANRDNI